MTGILVVADGEPLRSDVATMHLADFSVAIRQSGVETSQGLLAPEPLPIPFGFVYSPLLVSGVLVTRQFIVPPEVMVRREVRAWRFQTTDFRLKSGYGPYWLFVTRAEPFQ